MSWGFFTGVGRSALAVAGVVLFGFGCAGSGPGLPDDDDTGELDCVDLQEEITPRLDDSYFIEVPTMVVEPGAETVFCLYGTYEGPDAGIVSFYPEAPGGFLHHSLMKRVDDDEFSDGTLFDCTAEEFQFPPKPTLVEWVNGDGTDWVGLPEGVGFKFGQGQRWVTDVHYVNTSPDRLCVNTAFELDLVPEEDLLGYAGTFNLDAGKLAIPPNVESSTAFSCAWPSDVNILSLAGHMHGYGSRYKVDRLFDGEPSQNIYHVDPWLPQYRYLAPLNSYDIGEFVMAEGEELETECSWINPTGDTLGYPDEMCTTHGVAFPLETSFHCDGGEVLGGGP